MTRPRTTIGKRNVQQQKREKARAKEERRAARRAVEPDESTEPVDVSEAELIEELAALHGAVEAGRLSLEESEERREHIRKQLEQIERLAK
ncbi:MAG: hypothetical protein WBG41_06600 [Acidimicrobiales bacterium]